jgi:hypothetical protein
MKNSPEQELLGDVMVEPAFRAASLQHTLRILDRERRRRKRAAVGITLAAIVGALLVVRTERSKEVSYGRAQIAAAKNVPGTKIQIISDEELLALFPGRSVALIGPADHRQLVFLDERTTR